MLISNYAPVAPVARLIAANLHTGCPSQVWPPAGPAQAMAMGLLPAAAVAPSHDMPCSAACALAARRRPFSELEHCPCPAGSTCLCRECATVTRALCTMQAHATRCTCAAARTGRARDRATASAQLSCKTPGKSERSAAVACTAPQRPQRAVPSRAWGTGLLAPSCATAQPTDWVAGRHVRSLHTTCLGAMTWCVPASTSLRWCCEHFVCVRAACSQVMVPGQH